MSEARQADIVAAADALHAVYSGAPPVTPLRERFAAPDVETAYAIQEVNTERWLAAGKRLTGRKIGLTSEAVQKQLGVDQPDYGMLFDDMAVDEGEEIPFGAVSQARIEGEVAFILGADLDREGLDRETLVAAIDSAAAALEIVGSRIENWNISLFDTIADNASSGKYALGAARRPLDGLDLIGCRMVLTENGETVSEGVGAACLGDPLNAALWLARKMVEAGRPLRAGDVVMSGALGPFAAVTPGAVYDLSIEGLGTARAAFGARHD